MVDVLPRQLGHVDEAVHAAEVDERAEVDDRRHHAPADLAGLEVGQELVALLLLGLLQPGPPGQHHVVAVLVQLDDLGVEVAADVGLEVADPAQLDQRRRQEAAQADVEDEAALDDLDDRAGNDTVALLDRLDGPPGPLVLGPLLREDQAAFLVLLLQHQGLDALAERDDLVRVDVVADGQLAGRDDAFGLEPDVEQDLVLVHLDDGARDDVAVLELDDGAGDGVLEGRAAEVVGHHLARRVLALFVEGAHLLNGGCWIRVGRGVGHRVVAFFPDKDHPRERVVGGGSRRTIRRGIHVYTSAYEQQFRVVEVGWASGVCPGRTDQSPVMRRPAASAMSRSSRGVKQVVHRSKVADRPSGFLHLGPLVVDASGGVEGVPRLEVAHGEVGGERRDGDPASPLHRPRHLRQHQLRRPPP